MGDGIMTDEHRISKFSKEGGIAIISGDTDFLRRHQLVLEVGWLECVLSICRKRSNARRDLHERKLS